MNRLSEITLGDIGKGLRRYQPFIGIVVAILLIAVFLPGRQSGSDLATGEGGANFADTGGTAAAGGPKGKVGKFKGADSGSGEVSFDSGGGGGGGGGGGAAGGGGGGGTGPGVTTGPGGTAPPLVAPKGVGANCDTARGRLKVPTFLAPPCVAFSGSNGGSTYDGVTDKSIKVIYYQAQSNPAVDAALTAAGANNTPEEQRATNKDYVEYFNAEYELYGRQVDLVMVAGRGESDDDAAGRADAVDIAGMHPFAVYGGSATNNAFINTLVSKRILCICSVSQPEEFYAQRDPYVGYWGLMSSTQGYIHRAEYIGKRVAHRKAQWAGTSDGLPMNTKTRTFGLLYYETADKAYRSGVEFFKKELTKYNVSLKESLAFTGPPDLATTQEQARPYIQRLKSSGVTSVVFSGDPISPAIFTQEATRQLYFPEWIITGSALTDTTLFARTYDQRQWDKAFGISFLNARFPDEQTDPYKLHVWFHGRPPTAANQYGTLYAPIFALFTGIHMAGPNLTPFTFRDGLFRFPVTGQGMKTVSLTSWGKHGIWPFTDYTQYDDVTEIWWDPGATGQDEVGNQGRGMYRYVAGGKRYMPGQHPKTTASAFKTAGTVTIYDQRPANERPPDYPPPKH